MLDIQLRKMLDQMQAAGVPGLSDLPPALAREAYSQIARAGDVAPQGATIETRSFDGPGGPLALRIYRPQGDEAPHGLVLFIHGGGFVLGSPSDYDGVCSSLCRQSGCVLVQVDYRLAPEHPFPAAVDDVYAALCWAAEHAAEFGQGLPLIVAGESAGGNLAAVVALLARDREGPKIAQQTLIYPAVAPLPEMFESYRRNGSGYTLTTRDTWYFSDFYLGHPEPAAIDFRAAPLLAENHADLPPALILVAGYDPLRDEGMAYADKLNEAGTLASLVDYPGLAHGFISMSGVLDAARLAVAQVAAAWADVTH